MIAGRPIAIWLVLAFIAYGVFGTVANLGKAMSGAVSYSTGSIVFAAIMSLAGLWALAEIWRRGERRILAVGVNLGLFGFYYGSIIAATLSRGDTSAATTWLILATPIVGIWAIIYWYIRRTVLKEAAR